MTDLFVTGSVSFEVAPLSQTRPEGAQQNSPEQSDVALRHERRPGNENPKNAKALKGRNNASKFVLPFQGLANILGIETQGVA